MCFSCVKDSGILRDKMRYKGNKNYGKKVMIKTGSVLFQTTVQILRGRTKGNQETSQNYEIVSDS